MDKDNYLSVPAKVEGFKPVYGDTNQDIKELIYVDASRRKVKAELQYHYKRFMLMWEPNSGMHVYDNTDPANPLPLSFIHLPYTISVSVNDSIISTETYMGIVKISISQLPAIRILQYVRYTSNGSRGVPHLPIEPGSTFLFGTTRKKHFLECIDLKQPLILGWDSIELQNPKCYVYF